jgi:hypothetical protein
VADPILKHCPTCGALLEDALMHKMRCVPCNIYWRLSPGPQFVIIRAPAPGEGIEVYTHPVCLFHYCPTREICEPHNGCRHAAGSIPEKS